MKEVIKKLETKDASLKIVAEHLIKHCEQEPSFKDKILSEKKSLSECWDYIKSEAKKKAQSNCAVISDEEVFGLAVHYFDEEDLKFKSVQAKVKTSKTSKEEDIEEEEMVEEQEELTEVIEKPKLNLQKKKVDATNLFLKQNKAPENQVSLFDF